MNALFSVMQAAAQLYVNSIIVDVSLNYLLSQDVVSYLIESIEPLKLIRIGVPTGQIKVFQSMRLCLLTVH